ncbi:MAG: ABC transporter ATP-binding protein [Burkholderiales bacterium]|nr:ABC transporter ATP-binding protein [Burkholderiales bacterium]
MNALAGTAVRLEAADKRYPNGVRALQPIDLVVGKGEFVTLLGPSGCGKSTLLRMIAGLSAPSSGRLDLFPESPRAEAAPALAFVFQQPTLMPWASVERNVRLPLDLSGTPRPAAALRVREALALVGLSDFASAYPRQLSGGMQMRVSIARALVTEPRLLLMDEPFGALDELTRNRLDRDVRELWSRRKLTVIFVTHSIHEAVFLSTRVLVMSPRPGRLVGELTIDATHPRTDDFRLSTHFATLATRLSGMLETSGRDLRATT